MVGRIEEDGQWVAKGTVQEVFCGPLEEAVRPAAVIQEATHVRNLGVAPASRGTGGQVCYKFNIHGASRLGGALVVIIVLLLGAIGYSLARYKDYAKKYNNNNNEGLIPSDVVGTIVRVQTKVHW